MVFRSKPTSLPVQARNLWDVLRGVFYKLQSATELGGVFGDDPGGAFQATDARVTRQEGGMGSRRFYRVLTLPAP